MQDVREGDTLWSYWIAKEAEEPFEPIDLSSVTDVQVSVALQRNGKIVGAPIYLPGEVADAPAGLWRHQYDTLGPGIYFLSVTFTGLPGIGTAPSAQNALLRVFPKI